MMSAKKPNSIDEIREIYGGKLRDLSEGKTQSVTTRVLLLFSASDTSGIGENGLTATFTSIELLCLGAFALMIL